MFPKHNHFFMLKSNNSSFFFIILVLILIILLPNSSFAQNLGPTYETDSIFSLEEPLEELKNNRYLSDDLVGIEGRPLFPKPEGGYGNLHVVIESVEALNHSLISKKADRAELWLGHVLLSRLDKDDVKVLDQKTIRIFDFPIITLKSGYYFISVRLYSKGVLWKNKKFHEEIYQVGIHEDKRTNLRRKIPHLNW